MANANADMVLLAHHLDVLILMNAAIKCAIRVRYVKIRPAHLNVHVQKEQLVTHILHLAV